MKLSKIEKKLILFLQENVSEDELKTNFDKQVEFLNTEFIKLAKLPTENNNHYFLSNEFEKLKNSKGNRSDIAAKSELSSVLRIVCVNFDADKFYTLQLLFGILLGISLEISADKYENVSFKKISVSKNDHFKFIGRYINCQGDLLENFTKKTKLEKECFSENIELQNSEEMHKINQKDDNYNDDLLDGENDNFYYSYDSEEIEDNYEGLEWDGE